MQSYVTYNTWYAYGTYIDEPSLLAEISDRGQEAQAKAGRVPVLKTGKHPVLQWIDEAKSKTFVIEPKSIDYTEVAKQFNSYFVRSKQ